jgi:hypothetical protein
MKIIMVGQKNEYRILGDNAERCIICSELIPRASNEKIEAIAIADKTVREKNPILASNSMNLSTLFSYERIAIIAENPRTIYITERLIGF